MPIENKNTQHRQRWLNRIQNAENGFKILENGIHGVLDYIEDNDLDETIHAKLMELVKEVEPYRKKL